MQQFVAPIYNYVEGIVRLLAAYALCFLVNQSGVDREGKEFIDKEKLINKPLDRALKAWHTT